MTRRSKSNDLSHKSSQSAVAWAPRRTCLPRRDDDAYMHVQVAIHAANSCRDPLFIESGVCATRLGNHLLVIVEVH